MNKRTPPTPFFFLVTLVCSLVLLLNLAAIYSAWQGDYTIVFPDAYMRMSLVLEWMKHPAWFDHTLMRTNTPYGLDVHIWTRPLDILLLSGTLLFSAFYPLKKALWLWSFVVPIVFFVLSSLTLLWAFKPIQKKSYQAYFLVLAFIMNPFIHNIFLPLRVDYNFLSCFLFIVQLGFFLRYITHPKIHSAIGMGALFALGSWVSLSFFIAAASMIGYFHFLWLQSVRHKKPLRLFYATCLSLMAIFIALEHRPAWGVHFDTLAINYALLVVGGFLTTLLVDAFAHRALMRGLIFGLSWCGVLAILIWAFPGFYLGPYAATSLFVREKIFSHILEAMPPFWLGNAVFVAVFFYGLVSYLVFFFQYLEKKLKTIDWGLISTSMPLTALCFYMMKWNDYAQVLFIINISYCLAFIAPMLSLSARQNQRLSARVLALGAVGLALLPFALMQWHQPPYKQKTQACFYHTAKFMQHPNPLTNQGSASILSLLDHSPLVLFYSNHRVVAGNYHNNMQGIADTYQFFNGSLMQGKAILEKRKIDYVLFCRDRTWPLRSMGEALTQNTPPPYLVQIQTPDPALGISLYQVKRIPKANQ